MPYRSSRPVSAPLPVPPLPRAPRAAPLALAAALVLALTPAPAAARGGGDDEARVGGVCAGGASAELRLKADDGAIEVELRVERRRRGERWRVVLVHERRVAWRGSARTSGSGFRIRRTLPDFEGADEISAVASGPRGARCEASATLGG